MEHYDLIIIGGGPAGYIAAERAGALGKTVLLLEEQEIGGTCLNEGCIPTKTLIHSAKLYRSAGNSERFGVTAGEVTFNLATAMDYKEKVIKSLQKGIMQQLKHHGVKVEHARGVLVNATTVRAGDREVTAGKILLAQGSDSARPPIPGSRDNPRVLTSRELLQIRELPQRLIVIGGGYIGMEFASLFSALGSQVTVVEMMDEIIPMLEPETAQGLRRHLKKITYYLAHKVEKIEDNTVTIQDMKEGKDAIALEGDLILLATGRVPRAAGSGIAEAGVALHKGAIQVDEYQRTNIPGVYAAGDVTGRMLLAHAAYRMGEVAVAHMFHQDAGTRPGEGRAILPNRMRYHAIPWVVFTTPEVAGCGMNPSEARSAGYEIETTTMPLQISGRYLAEHPDERGTVTVTAESRTGRLLGVQMMGSGVGEIIHSAAVMIEQEMRVSEIREIVFPHPTVSEAVRDSIWALTV